MKKLRHRLLVIATLASAACGQGGADAERAVNLGGEGRLQAADQLYFSLELDGAREAFRQIFDDATVAGEHRATAALHLATIAARFDRQPARAHEWLDAGSAVDDGRYDLAAARVRVLEWSGELNEAWSTAREALATATRRREVIQATAAVGRVALARARAPKAAEIPEVRDAVAEARTLLGDLLEREWGWLEPSRAALGLALFAGDGVGAWTALRSYHRIQDDAGDPRGAMQTAANDPAQPIVSGRQLRHWTGEGSTRELLADVVAELSSSGFHAEAGLVVGRWAAARRSAANPDDPAFAEVVAYARFMERVRASADDYYRRRALGEAAFGELESTFAEHGRALWDELRWPDSRPAFSRDALQAELSRRFGAEFYWTRSDFARSLYYGHRIEEVDRSVSQYGRSAEVRFIVLDEMVTSGYSTWFWDGRAATGGWVNEAGDIVQVRAPYAEDPLEAWIDVTDPSARERVDRDIARQRASDADIAAADPYAYLPGLALRLEQQGYGAILRDLEARGLAGDALRASFLAEVEERIRASSIFAHEGRHALDRADGPLGWMRRDTDREYRAKLSEVAFAPSPRLALIGGILAANIGDETSHGRANERVVRNLVVWMGDNASEIRGLDRAAPLLPQLDLLTDEQIRAAFRWMDPWSP